MNFYTVLFLANPKCRAVRLAYEWCDENGKDVNGKPVNTDVFKTLDQTISVGDLVLGETQSRHRHAVYKVVEVDIEIDLEHSHYIPWVACKVDSTLSASRAMEDEMLTAIRRRDKEKKRADLAETMLKDYGDVIRNLQVSSNPAISAPPHD